MISRLKMLDPIIILPLILSIPCGMICAFFALMGLIESREQEEFLSRLLPREIVIDLCSHDLVPSSVGDCEDKNLSVTLRFLPDIFRANINSDATNDDVNRLFGKYLDKCITHISATPPNSYTCWYNLKSDAVLITFNADTNLLISMNFSYQ